MDLEKRARRQSRRVIISEILMLFAVIATVMVLVFVVSGYWLNSDFEVERQGMLQVSSVPTGATVEIDGVQNSWLQRTNTSKVLSSGEHAIKLTKDGYDSWEKTISIREGLLYRLHYPRLFLQEREKVSVYDTATATFATVSPNRNFVLLANNTTNWKLLNLDSDKPEAKTIDIAKAFSAASPSEETTGLFVGEISSADWDSNSEHILFKVKTGDSYEWVVLDIRNPSNSVNITREFATRFDDIKILNSSASALLAVRDGNLHKIDLTSRQISAIIVEKVHSFDHFESEIVFVADRTDAPDDEASPYYIGLTKLGDDKIQTLSSLDAPAKITISKFYDDKYVTVLLGDTVSLHKLNSFDDNVFSTKLSFSPNKIKVGHDGNFVTMNDGGHIATLDMEAVTVREWNTSSDHFGWLVDDMIYSVADGELSVYDFDGLNHRVLSRNVSSHFPITITNDKWLYYFSDGEIIREQIAN